MTVKELIQELQECYPEGEVLVLEKGYRWSDGNYDESTWGVLNGVGQIGVDIYLYSDKNDMED